MANLLTITAVARQAGLRTSAIRYYETIGLLPPPVRVSGRRRYGPDALPRLALIGVARQMGFTLSEIDVLLHGFDAGTPVGERWRVLANRKLPEVDAVIARAERMRHLLGEMLTCGCRSIDSCGRALLGASQACPPAVPTAG